MGIAKQSPGSPCFEAEGSLRKAIARRYTADGLAEGQFPRGLAANGGCRGVAQQLWKDTRGLADYSSTVARRPATRIAYRNRVHSRASSSLEHAALISSLITQERVPIDGSPRATRWVSRCCRLTVNESQLDFPSWKGKSGSGGSAVNTWVTVGARDHPRSRGGPGAFSVDLGLQGNGRSRRRRTRCFGVAVKCGALDSTGRRARECLDALDRRLVATRAAQTVNRLSANSLSARRRENVRSPRRFEKSELLRAGKGSPGSVRSPGAFLCTRLSREPAAAQDGLPHWRISSRRRDARWHGSGGIRLAAFEAPDDEEGGRCSSCGSTTSRRVRGGCLQLVYATRASLRDSIASRIVHAGSTTSQEARRSCWRWSSRRSKHRGAQEMTNQDLLMRGRSRASACSGDLAML